MIAFLKRVRRFLWVAGLAGLVLDAGGARIAALAAEGAPPAAGEQRIVSIGGDVTEIVFALGLGDRIVAVDTTSLYPEAVKEKKSVGYMRALSTEGVLSVHPTLIIASAHAGPPEVVAALKASTVPYVEVKAEESPDGIASKIGAVAATLGVAAEGERLAERVKAEFETVAAKRALVTKPVRALFIMARQEGRTMAAGARTAADAMFALAGAVNAMTGFDGYKPLSDEAAITAAPDVIVVMQRGGGSDGATLTKEIAASKGLGSTPAAKAGRIIAVEGSYTLQFGPRAASAARELMQSFYPDLAAAPAATGQP